MALPITVVVDACAAEPRQVVTALESVIEQEGGVARAIVVGPIGGALADALVPFEGDATLLDVGATPRGEARNRALRGVQTEYAAIVDGHEWLAAGALVRQVAGLDGEPAAVASYGRTAVHTGSQVRVRPEEGRAGDVLGRAVSDKHLLSAAAALVWRRAALPAAPQGPYTTSWALRLDLTLALARRGAFAFHPAVLAERTDEVDDVVVQEELVKVLVGVLYAPEPLDPSLEARLRVRLARHLVAIGKHHYRAEDYTRAGKLFDEAVRAAPGYFKGRRYQFLNFVQKTLAR